MSNFIFFKTAKFYIWIQQVISNNIEGCFKCFPLSYFLKTNCVKLCYARSQQLVHYKIQKEKRKTRTHIHSTMNPPSQYMIIIQSHFQNALTATLNYLDSLNRSGASSSMHHPFPHNVTWNPSIHWKPLMTQFSTTLFPHYVNPQPPSIAPSIANPL